MERPSMSSARPVGPLGAHTSAAGGVWNALVEGGEIGATTIQFFTSNQRRWQGTTFSQATIDRFRATRAALGLSHLMSHASYLLNLGSPNPTNLAKSRQAFREEVVRCTDLDLSYLNFHPGAALEGSRAACLDRIVESLLAVRDLLVGKELCLLIEMTAGQGSVVGSSLEEIAYLVTNLESEVPIGVCIDTCHLFAAGYDIRTPSAWDKVLGDFDKVVGLQHLYAFHLNDSLCELGSRKDRHANLGEGAIGMASFEHLMRSPITRSLPKYLETPGGPLVWQKEMAHLIEIGV